MRLYLSGPISNDSEYLTKFNEAQAYFMNEGYEVVNPANMCFVMQGMAWEEYMQIDLELLEICDALVQLPGWESSLGSQREYGYALARDKYIIAAEALYGRTKEG